MKREAMSHTKMKRLCRRMDIPLWQGVGLLESLWHITGRECPQGDIGKLSDEDIALAIDYRGDEAKMIDSLIAAGWLDRDPTFRLLVHDWYDHADDAVHMRLARTRQYFCNGRAPKLARLAHKERTACEQFYGLCAQSPPVSALPEPVTSNQQPVTRASNQLEKAATAAPVSIQDFAAVRETLAAAREKFPGTDAKMAQKIAAAARESVPDATDCEIAEAIRMSASRAKESAAFFVSTAPGLIETVRARARDAPHPEAEQNEAFERARELWRNAQTPEQRAEVEEIWPALRPGSSDEKHAS